MTVFRFRHVDKFTDRKGRVRYYFRRGHGPRLPLPADPSSTEFRQAYEAALGDFAPPKATKPHRVVGTFAWLLQQYLESVSYSKLASSTRYASRRAMERYLSNDDLSHRRFADVRLQHVEKMMARRASTPGAANDLLKKLRALYKFAIKNKWTTSDPTVGADRFKGGEFHTWTDHEIAQFEAGFPVGTRGRTAFALLLYTGQRMADVSEMVWSDLVNGQAIRVTQNKTQAKLVIPLHSDLRSILSGLPRHHLSIITTEGGRPFTHKGFGNWMAERIARAGLPDRCVTHGLRKASARRLAEAGCTTKQIMAITGHRTSQMVDHYTKATEQAQMAIDAIDRLEKRTPNRNSQT